MQTFRPVLLKQGLDVCKEILLGQIRRAELILVGFPPARGKSLRFSSNWSSVKIVGRIVQRERPKGLLEVHEPVPRADFGMTMNESQSVSVVLTMLGGKSLKLRQDLVERWVLETEAWATSKEGTCTTTWGS